MKLAIILGLFALASAAPWYDEIDWTKVASRNLVVENGAFRRESRIIGGEAATQNQFPYQAGILITTDEDQTFFCGGALITETYVLSAAHCFFGAVEVQVRLGAQDVLSQETTQQRFTSTNILPHPFWNPGNLDNDFALIALPSAATLNDAVQTAKLPTWSQVNQTFAGESARVLGWGAQADNNLTVSDTLRYVDTTIMTNLACNVGFLGQILPSHICTSGEDGVGACAGDSGGCVVTEDDTLVGIIIFALGFSCEAGWPSGHARVTMALPWISEVTGVEIDE